jgi:hypothetical protein
MSFSLYVEANMCFSLATSYVEEINLANSDGDLEGLTALLAPTVRDLASPQYRFEYLNSVDGQC